MLLILLDHLYFYFALEELNRWILIYFFFRLKAGAGFTCLQDLQE